jgi:hypothetical protein
MIRIGQKENGKHAAEIKDVAHGLAQLLQHSRIVPVPASVESDGT